MSITQPFKEQQDAYFMKAIHDSLKQEINRYAEIEIKAAQDRIDRAVRDALAEISLRLLKRYSIMTDRENLVITVLNGKDSDLQL